MKIPESDIEIFEFVQKGHEETLELHSNLNKDYISHIADSVSQTRDFYKNLTSLSGIILGFSPFFFEKGNVQQEGLFFSGIILFLLVIILVSNYLRSVLDVEGNEFRKQLDEYNLMLYPQMEARRKFFEGGTFTPETLHALFLEMGKISQSTIDLLKKRDIDSIKLKKRKEMDYAGEFFTLFFASGIILIALSFTNIHLIISEWLLFGFSFVFINFFFPFHKLFIYLGTPIERIKKILCAKE